MGRRGTRNIQKPWTVVLLLPDCSPPFGSNPPYPPYHELRDDDFDDHKTNAHTLQNVQVSP